MFLFFVLKLFVACHCLNLYSVLVIIIYSVECLTFNKEGSVLFCGLASGEVAVLRTWDLERICSIDLPEYGGITCLKLVAGMFMYVYIMCVRDGITSHGMLTCCLF